jgi:serine/threonine-protein kinase
MQHAPPKLPDRYRDARLIARGGMGEVWRARDSQLGRDVALKRLLPGDGAEPEAARHERFTREARAIAQLSTHPNVVTIYDVGDEDGQPWLALEWLPGGTLAERLREEHAHDPHRVVAWLRQVAAGLDAAHAAGSEHRAVKPGYILFSADDDARIGDFGIAQWAGDAAAGLTMPGSVIGTAGYMSPEQGRGEPSTARSDQYALFVIAYEALVGQRPFRRDDALAELAAHVSEPVPSASRARPALPGSVDAVIERALAKDAVDRYPSCTAAVDALVAALDEPTTAPTRILAAPAAAAPARSYAQRRPGLIAVAILLLALAGALAVHAAGSDPSSPGAKTPATTPPTKPAKTTAATATPTTTPTTSAADRAAAIAENDRAFELLQQGRFAEALALAQGALPRLAGVEPQEAYANYNIAASLIGLGRCSEALPYLDRSEALQGHRDEIDAARRQANECIAANASPGNAKGHKDKHGKGG